ncbi:MAG TPA: phytanoyl-CoA dioxygenase family protein [Streptosporangiaceae bacterium]|nr:phytanoyl-CoA dioxygenase family protein [Streptosporangiaceae bacterium]
MTTTSDFTLTEAELDLLPTDAEVQKYARHGWYLTRKLFTDDEVDALVAASDAFYAGQRDRTLPFHPPNLAYWEPSHGPVQRHNDYVHYESDAIAAILRKPVLGAVAARLAGCAQIRVFQATLIYKPPISGEASNLVPWHADRHYWQTCTSERMLTAFIPFHDCGVQMGTITMIDGSHLWQDIPGDDSTRHFAQRDRGELEDLLHKTAQYNGATVDPIPMVIPKGHLSFHHCHIYHGSGHNRADVPRRAISLHLQDGENQWRPFDRLDGTRVVYNHDVLVRSTAAGTPDYADPAYCPALWQS